MVHTHTHTERERERTKIYIIFLSSGDGSLTAVDMRQRKLEQRSDCSESELLCVTIVKVSIKLK